MTSHALKVQIDPRTYEAHGLCIELAPGVFEINGDDVAEGSDEVFDEKHASVLNTAAAACPRQAISVSHTQDPADRDMSTKAP